MINQEQMDKNWDELHHIIDTHFVRAIKIRKYTHCWNHNDKQSIHETKISNKWTEKMLLMTLKTLSFWSITIARLQTVNLHDILIQSLDVVNTFNVWILMLVIGFDLHVYLWTKLLSYKLT